MAKVLSLLKSHIVLRRIHSVHNYATLENYNGKNLWVHRKGAIKLRKDIIGIIPGSMGTSTFIVSGKGNDDSFNSASHGSGRAMSRSEANKEITVS